MDSYKRCGRKKVVVSVSGAFSRILFYLSFIYLIRYEHDAPQLIVAFAAQCIRGRSHHGHAVLQLNQSPLAVALALQRAPQ